MMTKKWLNVIFRKDFEPTMAAFSLHGNLNRAIIWKELVIIILFTRFRLLTTTIKLHWIRSSITVKC